MRYTLILTILFLFCFFPSFSQFNKEQLRVCSWKQQSQLFDSIVQRGVRDGEELSGDHHLNFIFGVGHVLSCTALDTTKEIRLSKDILLKSDGPYPEEPDTTVVVFINKDGYINRAYLEKGKKRWAEIGLEEKLNNSTDTEMKIFRRQFEYVADVLGITSGNITLRQEDFISKEIKRTILARKSAIPCDQSNVGKLIVKPLIKNGRVDYSLALGPIEASEKIKGHESADFVQLSTSWHNSNSFTLTRIRVWGNDSIAYLKYEYDQGSNQCYYSFSFISKSKSINTGSAIDEYGMTNTPESGVFYADSAMAKNYKELAEQVMKNMQR